MKEQKKDMRSGKKMNKKDKLRKESEYRSLLDINSKKYRNVAKCWGGTTYQHFRVLSDILWKLINDYGMEVYSEAVFRNGARADLFAFNGNLAVIIEVAHSESEQRLAKKEEYYPDIPIIKVRTKDFSIDDFKI